MAAAAALASLLPSDALPFDGALISLAPVVPRASLVGVLSSAEVTCVASAEKLIAFGSRDGTAIVVDRFWAVHAALVRPPSAASGAATAVAWASTDILACGYADGSVALWNPTNSPKSQLLREFRAHSAAIVHISPLLLLPGAPIELLALDRGGVAKFHVLARSMWNRAQLSAKVVSSGGGASILGVPALDAHRIAALALSRDSGLAAVAPRVSSGAAGAGIIIIALPRVVAENGAIAPQRLELPPFTHSLPMESAFAQPCLGWLRADSARAAAYTMHVVRQC